MSRLISAGCFLGLCTLLGGCGGPEYDGDKRYPLSGSATFDGQPIDLGSVTMTPSGEGGRASGGVIENGKYVVPEETGFTKGKYRVEVSWLKKTGKRLLDADTGEMYDQRIEALPPKFNKNTELSIEIPAPDDTHNFDLKSN